MSAKSKKITVRLMGGLGNQMFQYAFGRQLAVDNGMELYLDASSYLRDKKRRYSLGCFNIKAEKLNPIVSLYYDMLYYLYVKLDHKRKNVVIEEEVFGYDEIEAENSAYYIGNWINEDYFKRIGQELIASFIYQGKFDERVRKVLERERISESVAVHVRRGDYMTNGNETIYVAQGKTYYDKARNYMEARKKDLIFYVFSDDITWCKENLGWQDACFIDDSVADDDIIQFELMKNCKNFIVGNSTYSWWAAWLAESPDKICIAPQRWYVNDDSNEACLKALCKNFVLL